MTMIWKVCGGVLLSSNSDQSQKPDCFMLLAAGDIGFLNRCTSLTTLFIYNNPRLYGAFLCPSYRHFCSLPLTTVPLIAQAP